MQHVCVLDLLGCIEINSLKEDILAYHDQACPVDESQIIKAEVNTDIQRHVRFLTAAPRSLNALFPPPKIRKEKNIYPINVA